MSKKDLLIQEIERVSDDYVEEILEFIHFIQMKQLCQSSELTIASERALAKDWFKPEEEQAWKDL